MPKVTNYVIYIDGKFKEEIPVDLGKDNMTGVHVLAKAADLAVNNPGYHVSIEIEVD